MSKKHEAIDRFAPIRLNGVLALAEHRVLWHLQNWANWQRTTGLELGVVMSDGVRGASDFDGMCRDMDRSNARTTDAVISDLPAGQKAAIYHRHLRAVFRFPRGNLYKLYTEAKLALALGLFRKHLI